MKEKSKPLFSINSFMSRNSNKIQKGIGLFFLLVSIALLVSGALGPEELKAKSSILSLSTLFVSFSTI